MRRLVLVLSGLAAALAIAAVALAVIFLTRGGINEEAYRQKVRPLILAWQDNIGLSTLTCGSQDQGGTFTEQDVEVLAAVAMALTEIQRDVQALKTPERYRPGVAAMEAVAAEIAALEKDLEGLLQAGRELGQFNPEEALADVPPTAENVSWFVRVGGAFEAWGTDFLKWSDFIDCTLPKAPERVGELVGYQRQLEIDVAELNRLRQEGSQELVAAFAPVFNAIGISTQAFAKLSRALEHQVEVERSFADVIAGP